MINNDVYISNDIILSNDTRIKIIDKLFPCSYVYRSLNDFNPNTAFPDTKWKKLVNENTLIIDGNNYVLWEKIHNYVNGICTICGHNCIHKKYVNGFCTICDTQCKHTYTNNYCTICNYHWDDKIKIQYYDNYENKDITMNIDLSTLEEITDNVYLTYIFERKYEVLYYDEDDNEIPETFKTSNKEYTLDEVTLYRGGIYINHWYCCIYITNDRLFAIASSDEDSGHIVFRLK